MFAAVLGLIPSRSSPSSTFCFSKRGCPLIYILLSLRLTLAPGSSQHESAISSLLMETSPRIYRVPLGILQVFLHYFLR